MLSCARVWDRLPRTTGTAASPQQRQNRYCFRAAYQTTGPNWDGPEKEKPKLKTFRSPQESLSVASVRH